MKPYQKLRVALFANDITQLELAEEMGCHFTHISVLMRGRSDWRLSECYKVLDIIGVPHDQLPEYFPQKPFEQQYEPELEKAN